MAIQQLNTTDAAFPHRLTHLHKPPEKLFVKGDLSMSRPLVAIVGSRRPSSYGQSVTQDISSGLSRLGIGIVSGLALGLDAVAHSACLNADGYTVAVLAHGLDTVSPRKHANLATRILSAGGALVSEYAVGSHIYASNFIERNRIVAALADAIVVVEAGERSGTMSTARFGLELGRPILAVPGSIHSVLSKGTNNLIKVGAQPLTEVGDVLEAIGFEYKNNAEHQANGKTKAENAILTALQTNSHSGSELQQLCGLEQHEFLSTLTTLEIEGRIRTGGNNMWFLRQIM